MEQWERRIRKVLGKDTERCNRNAKRWRTHLLEQLPLPIQVTGIEDLPWEEPYVFGGWDKQKYERLKKTKPSYTDVFELVDIGGPDAHDDLVAEL